MVPWLLGLLACAADVDGDGLRGADDCDDADPARGAAWAWHADADGDGHGEAASGEVSCARPPGHVRLGDDCDDAVAAVNPEADEICDSRDDDCDGFVDEGGADRALYADVDGDGYGDPSVATEGCAVIAGVSANPLDCDDTDGSVHPAAVEVCDGRDANCDGIGDDVQAADATVWYVDVDADGFGDARAGTIACDRPDGYVSIAGDCADGDAAVGPSAPELCDGRDTDCDGAIDEDAADAPAWRRDRDGDGYGEASDVVNACEAPSGYVAAGGDCDDTAADVNPATRWYADADADKFGAGTPIAACVAPSGRVRSDRDCDDAAKAVHPGASETCNERDDDCDGVIDGEAASDAAVWFLDRDGDGFGDPRASGKGCEAPAGFVADGSDCDDGAAKIAPGAAEVCDRADNDCDGKIDAADPGLSGVPTWYLDADRDGHGSPDKGIATCDGPTGRVLAGDDCDDTDEDVRPGRTEVCNLVDDDCDGLIDGKDPGQTGNATFYADADGDGFGLTAVTRVSCDPQAGWSDDDGDCDDKSVGVNPGATEICGNFVDDDCDGGPDVCLLPPVIDVAVARPDGWRGSAASEGFGRAVIGAGDLDGDERDDLVVGATGASRASVAAGGIYVIAGSSAGDPLSNSAEPALAFWRGEKGYDYAGAAVGIAGDLDGDAVTELIVGAYAHDASAKTDAGAVYIVSGAVRGSQLLSLGLARLYGENAYDNAGCSVAGAGDIDDDGRPNIIVGAYGADDAGSYSGAAYVLSSVAGASSLGTAYAKLIGATESDQAGRSVAGGGDADGDGRADVMIGAIQAEASGRGAAYVITDVASGVSSLADADLTLIGASYSAYTGGSVAFAGDVDSDGRDDLLIGAYGENAAYLVLGGKTGRVNLRQADVWYEGPDDSDTGRSVAAAGDIDNDGLIDVVIGGPRAGSGAYQTQGRAWVVLGGVTSGVVDLTNDAGVVLIGAANYDETGASVAGVGDTDGDGFADVAVGAPGWDVSSSIYSVGAVYLVRGTGL